MRKSNYIIMGIILILILIPFKGLHMNTGLGSHAGIITGYTAQGIILKTNRVYFQTSATSSKTSIYCVPNKSLYKKLQKLSSGNTRVVIYYKSWLINGIYNCAGEDNYVYAVEKI